MIKNLTKEQKSIIPVYYEKFLNAGTSNHDESEFDLKRINQEVKNLYKALGNEEPKFIITLDSPLSAQLCANFIDKKGSQLGDQLEDQLGDQLGDQLEGQLWARLWAWLWDQFGDQLRAQLCGQLWDQLGDQLGGQLEGKLNYYHSFHGAGENYWLSFYSFIGRELTKSHDDYLSPLEYIFKNSSSMIPFKNWVFLSKKPIHQSWQNNRLHNEEKAAIEWADGYKIHFLRGVRVPEWVIKKESPENVLKELKNAEQRRVAIQHYGVENLLNYLDSKSIDSSNEYELLKINFEGAPTGPWLKMTCPSTGRIYIEAVGESGTGYDERIKTVKDAFNWRIQRASGGLITGLAKVISINA